MNSPLQLSKVVIFGVGLIGGSFALGLKKKSAVKHIVGVERHPEALARALKLGIIDEIGTDLSKALDAADLILIAVPVAQTESVLRSIYPHLQPQSIVTDAGSTKSDVVAAARRALAEKISQFVPAHPIAGRESHGPDAALADLYQGKKIVISTLPENTPDAVNIVAGVWELCGAVPCYLNPGQHDQVFAAVSHLPHLLAYATMNHIAERADAELCFRFAGSGFRDFTRIAGASAEMWRDISLANRNVLLKELEHYQAQLKRVATALRNENGDQLLAMFSGAQMARQHWLTSLKLEDPLSEQDEP